MTNTLFGALGSLAARGSRGWRKAVMGAGDGLYATIAVPGHGILRVTLRPTAGLKDAPEVEVQWGSYSGQGPSPPKVLYKGTPSDKAAVRECELPNNTTVILGKENQYEYRCGVCGVAAYGRKGRIRCNQCDKHIHRDSSVQP